MYLMLFVLKNNEPKTPLFEFIKSCPVNPLRNEKELPSAIVNMISHDSLYMKGIPIAEHVPDLTSKSDIQIIQKLIESK